MEHLHDCIVPRQAIAEATQSHFSSMDYRTELISPSLRCLGDLAFKHITAKSLECFGVSPVEFD